MESLALHFFCLTGCPLRSLLSLGALSSVPFTLDVLLHSSVLSPSGCAFFRSWSHSVYPKNGVSSVLNSDLRSGF